MYHTACVLPRELVVFFCTGSGSRGSWAGETQCPMPSHCISPKETCRGVRYLLGGGNAKVTTQCIGGESFIRQHLIHTPLSHARYSISNPSSSPPHHHHHHRINRSASIRADRRSLPPSISSLPMYLPFSSVLAAASRRRPDDRGGRRVDPLREAGEVARTLDRRGLARMLRG